MTDRALTLGLIGYGRMGHEVEAAANAAGHRVTVTLDVADNADGGGITSEAFDGVDAAIEFSQPDAVLTNIKRAAEIGLPLVVGTTGWDAHRDEAKRLVDDNNAALVHGANFSIGANLFFRLVEAAAALFDRFDGYDPYVLEHHHRNKLDTPSGTASRLAQILVDGIERKTSILPGNPEGAIEPAALQVASVRSGAAFGQHRVGFDSSADSIELVHTARGRDGFAEGALMAAQWIVGKKGFFAFADVLDDILDEAGSTNHDGDR